MLGHDGDTRRSWNAAKATFSTGTTRGLSSRCSPSMYPQSTAETLSPACGCLRRPAQELEAQPQLEDRALRGLADTLAVIMERFPAGSHNRRSSGDVARIVPGRIVRHRNDGANPAGCRTRTEADGVVTLEHLGNRGADLLVYPAGGASTDMDPVFRSLFAMGGRSVGSSRRVSSSAGRRRHTGAPPAASRLAFLGRSGSRRNRRASGHLAGRRR